MDSTSRDKRRFAWKEGDLVWSRAPERTGAPWVAVSDTTEDRLRWDGSAADWPENVKTNLGDGGVDLTDGVAVARWLRDHDYEISAD